MVDVIEAYRILNQSVLDVILSLVPLQPVKMDKPQELVRLEEAVYSIAEQKKITDGLTVVCHDLTQYINRFYKIQLESGDIAPIDYLIDTNEYDIDFTEFGEGLC